jgi:DmsE family decaheme c-type cytochrome
MNCNSCHSTHHAKAESMLRTSVLELCFSCHKDIQKALHQRSTHLFRTEQQVAKLDCTSCHDAHGGQGRKMLVASSTNQVCYTCHAEKRGPFLWEHPPVREDCFTCHVPHGSNQLSLLRTRSHMLCQQCHMNMLWRHQTVAGFDIFTFNRGCVNCHSQVHGSNHPSGKGFTR